MLDILLSVALPAAAAVANGDIYFLSSICTGLVSSSPYGTSSAMLYAASLPFWSPISTRVTHAAAPAE